MLRNNASWPNILLALLTCGSAWCQAQQTALEPPHSMFRVPIERGALVREVPPSQNTQTLAVTFTFGTIDYPNGPQTVAQSVNKKGEIVGSWGPDINDFRQGLTASGFVLKGTTFKKIAYPSVPTTVPYGVNSAGEIVGFYSLDPLERADMGSRWWARHSRVLIARARSTRCSLQSTKAGRSLQLLVSAVFLSANRTSSRAVCSRRCCIPGQSTALRMASTMLAKLLVPIPTTESPPTVSP